MVGVADYITATKEVADAVAQYRQSHPDVPTTFLTNGRLSPGTLQIFRTADGRVASEGGLP